MLLIATCATLPDWEVDDRPFHDALRDRGVTFEIVPWDADADWAAASACLIRTTWDYQDRLEEFLAWVGRVSAVTRLFNDPAVVRWNASKTYLRDLDAAGIPTLPTVWIERGAAPDVDMIMRDTGWPKAMLKPAVGATARGTLPFDASLDGLAAAESHLATWLRTDDFLLQPYCRSVESLGEVSILAIDGEITHAVRKLPVPGDYRVQDDFGGTDARIPVDEALGEIAGRAFAAVGTDLLYGRADFLLDDDERPALTELELIEPSLFFRHAPEAAERLADAIVARLGA